MEKVILNYDGRAYYLFGINNIDDLRKAIWYKDEIRADNVEDYIDYSDFEIIIEYLDKHNIEYSYIELFGIKELEY